MVYCQQKLDIEITTSWLLPQALLRTTISTGEINSVSSNRPTVALEN